MIPIIQELSQSYSMGSGSIQFIISSVPRVGSVDKIGSIGSLDRLRD